MKKFFHILLKIIKWAAVILLVAAIFSALYNLTLPSESETTEYLLADQKAYIIEMDHLRRTAGNDVWPGWGDQSVPVIVYNESYAFLIGYPDPPDGWLKMPSGEFRGTSWQKVQNDEINGERYYRQPLPDPHITPENFTVKVGDRWVLTMQTKEYAAVSFYNGFRNELPPILSAVFPYRLFWNLLMGTAENYIAGMAHEAFHAHQGMLVPDRLAQAENAARLSSDYPWHKPENAAGWEEEIDLLLESYHSGTSEDSKYFIEQFLEKRRERRKLAELTGEMILYEQQREWLEGLAKYAELKIGLVASENSEYSPVSQIQQTAGFRHYETREQYFRRQLDEVGRTAKREGESRFYYGGMLQAILLDRHVPEWKSDAFDNNVYLDQLLEKALKSVTSL
ncbi:MAG: hypothetical protein ABR545_05940 [Cyclonatronaceae bacterium]